MARTFTRDFATLSRDTKKYYLKEDLDDKGKPVKGALEFILRPMSKKQLALYQDSSSRMNVYNSTILLGNASNELDLFRTNVVGINNFIVDKEEYIFKRDNANLVDEEITEILPLDIISEVAKEILRISLIPEDIEKK